MIHEHPTNARGIKEKDAHISEHPQGTSQTLNLTLQHERAIMNTQQRKENLSQTRKGNNMTKMTYAQALTFAIDNISNETVKERLNTLKETLARRSGNKSDESKAKANAKRKEKTAQARAELMKQVLPIVREAVGDGGTTKEIFDRCADSLPEDFTSAKVQYILLHEMKDEVTKVETKNKPNVYRLN